LPRLDSVEPAFVSLARPSVPEALERVTLLGAREVAVVPYFLFTGLLVDRIGAQAREWAGGHTEVTVAVGAHLGAERRLVDLVIERYEEARTGGARMNCDCCVHRVALPGYEDRVGTPVPGA
jgi:sirohydrochlorin ferrochelatase